MKTRPLLRNVFCYLHHRYRRREGGWRGGYNECCCEPSPAGTQPEQAVVLHMRTDQRQKHQLPGLEQTQPRKWNPQPYGISYLLTKSEYGQYQTEAFLYWPSNSEVNASWLKSPKDRTLDVDKYYIILYVIIWLTGFACCDWAIPGL